jgi:uncharacterized protein YggE
VSELIDKLRDLEVPLLNIDAADIADDEGSGTLQPIVLFVLEDAGELRERAYERAFAAARRDAQRLAKLAGAKLGPVISISDSSSQENQAAAMYYTLRGTPTEETDANSSRLRVSSFKFVPIPVRVTLQVRFALEKETHR